MIDHVGKRIQLRYNDPIAYCKAAELASCCFFFLKLPLDIRLAIRIRGVQQYNGIKKKSTTLLATTIYGLCIIYSTNQSKR